MKPAKTIKGLEKKVEFLERFIDRMADAIEQANSVIDNKWNAGLEYYNECRWDERTARVVPA